MRCVDRFSYATVATSLVAVLTISACGADTAGLVAVAPAESPTTIPKHSMIVGTPSLDETTTSTVQPPSNPLEPGEDLWRWYGGESEEEANHTRTLSELSSRADVVVLGKVVDISLGRVLDVYPDLPQYQFQYVNYTIEVARLAGAPATELIMIEQGLGVTSPELDAAVAAAKNLVDLNRDGQFDDRESAAAIDDEAIAAAYVDLWDDAVQQSLARETDRIPDNETLFFLRVDANGTYRTFNASSIIVNDAGLATVPYLGPGELQPIASEIAGTPFDDIVMRAFDGAA
jgi:hypothetical protein